MQLERLELESSPEVEVTKYQSRYVPTPVSIFIGTIPSFSHLQGTLSERFYKKEGNIPVEIKLTFRGDPSVIATTIPKILKKRPEIIALRISGVHLQTTHLQTVIPSIEYNETLEELSFESNELDDAFFELLPELTRVFPNLKKIYLGSNYFSLALRVQFFMSQISACFGSSLIQTPEKLMPWSHLEFYFD